jgi:hypothetical protein
VCGVFAVVLAAATVAQDAHALQPADPVKISEVCYDPSEVPETMFEYVELYNAGADTVYLDGAVLSDQGNNNGNETTFQFPGAALTGTTLPLAPGAFVLIVGSASGSPYADIDFEFYGGLNDSDDPAVPNLVKTSGLGNDLGLANTGDGVTLSCGVSTGNIIPCAEIVDGVSWEDGGGIDEVTSTSRNQCSDPAVHPGWGDGNRSLQRRSNGNDTDRSADDFGVAVRTPGTPAPCVLTGPCVAGPSFAPCVPAGNQPVTVTVRVATAPAAGWSARVLFKLEAAAVWDSVAAIPVDDSLLVATLPGRPNLSRILFWVRASDPDGNVVQLPAAGAAAPAQYHVGALAIAAIQSPTLADSCASSTLVGKAVAVRGLVTHERHEFDTLSFYVQRGTGAASAIRVFDPSGLFAPDRGDSVEVAGIVDEADCQTRIVLTAGCGRVLAEHRPVVPRLLPTVAAAALEENESMLVRLPGPLVVSALVDSSGGDFEWRVTGPTGSAWIGGDTFAPDGIGYSYVPQLGRVLDGVTGIVAPRALDGQDPAVRLRVEPRRDYDVDLEYTDVEETPVAVIRPARIARNTPNPFNPATTIEYEIAAAGEVRLRIFDASGRAVRDLLSGEVRLGSGIHRATWDGRDDAGNLQPSGLYVVRLEAGDTSATRKVVLLR